MSSVRTERQTTTTFHAARSKWVFIQSVAGGWLKTLWNYYHGVDCFECHWFDVVGKLFLECLLIFVDFISASIIHLPFQIERLININWYWLIIYIWIGLPYSIHPLIYPFTHSFIKFIISINSFIYSSIPSITFPTIHSLIFHQMHSFLSFIHSFI